MENENNDAKLANLHEHLTEKYPEDKLCRLYADRN